MNRDLTSGRNAWRVASVVTLTSGAVWMFAAGGCATGPDTAAEPEAMACESGEEAGEVVAVVECEDAPVEVACEVEPSEGETAAEGEPELVVVAVEEDGTETPVESEVVAVVETEGDTGEVVVVVEATPVEPMPTETESETEAEVEVEVEAADETEAVQVEVVEGVEIEPIAGETEMDEETDPDDAAPEVEVEAEVEVVEGVEIDSVDGEAEMVEGEDGDTEDVVEEMVEEIVVIPAFELVLDLAGDETDIGRRLLETFVATETASPVTGNLAAATATRLQARADAGAPVGTVRLHRVTLDRDQVAVIPGAVKGAEVLAATGTGGFAHVLGAEAEMVEPWTRVRSYRSAGDRPLLLWDRRADAGGWSGWVVVLTP